VRSDQAEVLKNELIARLKEFVDPDTGERVVNDVWLADEIYDGSEVKDAPDLVIGYGEGYRASWQTALGGVPGRLVQDNDRNWSGDHCVDPALVPGVLFTSFPLGAEVGSINDLPALIASGF
jgi:predicted AlkP superfamily phosphohydrolase/phosphomutase